MTSKIPRIAIRILRLNKENPIFVEIDLCRKKGLFCLESSVTLLRKHPSGGQYVRGGIYHHPVHCCGSWL